MIETLPNRPPRVTIPLVAGAVLVVAFFLPWFRVGPWLGGSGAGIVGATFAALTRFVAEHRATALMLPLLCVLLPAGGVAVVWTELLGRSVRNLQLTVACVAPVLLVLLCAATRDVHVLSRLDIGSLLTLVASLTLAATGAGLLHPPMWRGAPWWRALNVVVAVVLVACVAGAGAAAFEPDYGSHKVLLVLGDVGKRLDAGDPGRPTQTFAADGLGVDSGSDATDTTVAAPVDGDVASVPGGATAGASPVLVGRGALTPRRATTGTGTGTGTGIGTAGGDAGSGSPDTTTSTRSGSTGTTQAGTPPSTAHPTTTHPTTTTVPCPVGKPSSKVSDSQVTYHDPGSDYYEADVTVTVSNKASKSIDLFYAELLVNGQQNADGNPLVGMNGSLAPGKSKSFTGKVFVRTPNGDEPSFTVVGLNYRWTDETYRDRCET